jgi:hypothetical protein
MHGAIQGILLSDVHPNMNIDTANITEPTIIGGNLAGNVSLYLSEVGR